VIPGRLYWNCVRITPSETAEAHYFSTDELLVYDPYYGDFGPLNISQVCRYCKLLSKKFTDHADKRIVHCCKPQHDTRANSVLLICCWSLLYDRKGPEEAFAPFASLKPALCPYRDASLGPPCYNLTVLHCLHGLAKGLQFGWVDPDTFDSKTYEFYERVENGDFNWIVPGKFLAFSGPTQTPIAYVDGVKTNTPETYFEYFSNHNITAIVRFNNKVYDRKKFMDAGFNHYDLYFSDGGTPTDAIIKRFVEVSESEKGGLAVHCKAGLGRTGTLISLFLMKHFLMTAPEVISWLRLCRPGSVIGPQQNFLVDMEKRMHREGELYRKANPPAASASDAAISAQMRQLNVTSSPAARTPTQGTGTGLLPGTGRAVGSPSACRSPVAGPGSPNSIRPKSGFGIGVGPGRSSSPARTSGSLPLKQKAAGLLKR